MIILRLNGQNFENFTSMKVSNSLQALSGKFEFEATSNNKSDFPFSAGDKVEVLIQNRKLEIPISNGFIDSIRVNYSSKSHIIMISGRDKTEDILDSHIKDIEITGPFKLQDVIQRVLNVLGIKDIEIIDATSGIEEFKVNDVAALMHAESAFAFMNKYAEERQVLLSNDGNGNILLTRVEFPLRNGEILNLRSLSDSNNVISGSTTYDNSHRFNTYDAVSQGNTSQQCSERNIGDPALDKCPKSSNAALANQAGVTFTDDEIRTTRKFSIIATGAVTIDIAGKMAKWENALRIARTKKYTAVIQGFISSDKIVWERGQLVKVRDEFASINAEMIVSEISYSFSLGSGSTTTLTLVPQNVYIALLEVNKLKEEVNNVGKADSQLSGSGEQPL